MGYVQATQLGRKPEKPDVIDRINKGLGLAQNILGAVNMVQDIAEAPEKKRLAAEDAAMDRKYKTAQIAKLDAETAGTGKPKAMTPYEQARIDLENKKLSKLSLDGKQLPPDKVLLVNEGNTIPSQLKDIEETILNNKDSFGPIGGRISGMNPYNEKAQTIQSQLKSASQAFGRFMEGGVLRKEDEVKYEKMFPGQADTPEVAKNKLAIVNRLLINKQQSNLDALRAAGYNISGLKNTSGDAPDVPEVLKNKNGLNALISSQNAGFGAGGKIGSVKQKQLDDDLAEAKRRGLIK